MNCNTWSDFIVNIIISKKQKKTKEKKGWGDLQKYNNIMI